MPQSLPTSSTTSDAAAVQAHGWLAHTPQPDDPTPTGPGEPDAPPTGPDEPDPPPPIGPGEPEPPPIGDPPAQPGEVPHSQKGLHPWRRAASPMPAFGAVHKFCVLVTRRSKFLPAF